MSKASGDRVVAGTVATDSAIRVRVIAKPERTREHTPDPSGGRRRSGRAELEN